MLEELGWMVDGAIRRNLEQLRMCSGARMGCEAWFKVELMHHLLAGRTDGLTGWR